MCDTKSILTTGLIASAAFTGGGALALAGAVPGFTAVGGAAGVLAGGVATMGLFQAYNQNEQAMAQQKVLNQQAAVADAQAADAIARGGAAEEKHRQQVRLLEGEQRANMAAAGGELGSGTYSTILGQTAAAGEMDALTIRANAAREAWGYKANADTTRYQGNLARTKAKYDVFGSVLTGGVQAFGTYRKG